MARHKHPTQSLSDVAQTIALEGVKMREKQALSEPYTATLAQRVEEAEKRLAASETIASTCYWQGALDALNALSRGEHMPEVVGAGVPK